MRHARAIPLSLVILGAMAVAGAGAACAETRQPFSRLDVGLRAAADVSDTDFHDYWDRGRGVELTAATPFYAGALGLRSRFVMNEERSGSGATDLNALFLAVDWAVGRGIGGPLRAGAGVAIGFTTWIFSDEEIAGAETETEFGTEAGVFLSFRLSPAWSADLTGTYHVTDTHKPIELAFVSLGLTRSFAAPAWIRSVLE